MRFHVVQSQICSYIEFIITVLPCIEVHVLTRPWVGEQSFVSARAFLNSITMATVIILSRKAQNP
jgi:hypothetical protein